MGLVVAPGVKKKQACFKEVLAWHGLQIIDIAVFVVWGCQIRPDRIAEYQRGFNPFLAGVILSLQTDASSVSFVGADLNIESDTSI